MRFAQLSTGSKRPRTLSANLPAAAHHVFVTGQLLHADGPTGVKFIRADADFRTHAEFSAVGKLSGRIVKHDGAVDPRLNPLGRSGVIGHDALGMLRPVLPNVCDRRVYVVD